MLGIKQLCHWLGVLNFVQQSTKPKLNNYLRFRSGRAIKGLSNAQFWPILTLETKLVSSLSEKYIRPTF